MNKKTHYVLGISVALLFAVSVISITSIQTAMAKPSGNGQADLVATLIAEGTNDAKGHAWFWFDNDTDPTSLRYKIVLNKVDVGPVDNDGKGTDKNKGKGLEYFVESLHIHAAPGGVHDPEHLLNVIGPNDDDDLKIKGHTINGVWDDGDATGHHGHASKSLTSQIVALCSGDTDVNVHLSEHGEYIRGVIFTNSDACSALVP